MRNSDRVRVHDKKEHWGEGSLREKERWGESSL